MEINYETHKFLEHLMCHELDLIADKYKNKPGVEMDIQDFCKVKDLYSALMKQATWISMEEAENYSDERSSRSDGNMSGYRGRAANGRYVSRDMNPNYADGYSEGYSEAMKQMNRMHDYPRW